MLFYIGFGATILLETLITAKHVKDIIFLQKESFTVTFKESYTLFLTLIGLGPEILLPVTSNKLAKKMRNSEC